MAQKRMFQMGDTVRNKNTGTMVHLVLDIGFKKDEPWIEIQLPSGHRDRYFEWAWELVPPTPPTEAGAAEYEEIIALQDKLGHV